jgi:hypothetical protein
LQDNSKIVDRKINIAKGEEDLLKYSVASNQNITHRKIQLWTNKHQNEFAIRLTTDSEMLATSEDNDDDDDRNIFLTSTDANEDYIRVVAETDYFEPLKHGWEYTLRILIEQYKHEISIMSLRDVASTNNKKIEKTHSQGQENNNNNNTIPIRLIAYIKCRYCDLEFNTEEEKNEHELEQHM